MQEEIASTFLDYVAWLRRDGDVEQLQGHSMMALFGHLQIDYSNLHIVAALLTVADQIRGSE
jgi:hypothetical protein